MKSEKLTPRQEEALKRLADLAVKLHENGIIDLLEQLSELSPKAISYLAEPRILKIGANISFMLHILEVINPTIFSVMMNNFIDALSEEMTPEKMTDPPRATFGKMLKYMWDPDVQRALAMIFIFLKAFGASINTSAEQFKKMMDMMEKQFAKMREERSKRGIPIKE